MEYPTNIIQARESLYWIFKTSTDNWTKPLVVLASTTRSKTGSSSRIRFALPVYTHATGRIDIHFITNDIGTYLQALRKVKNAYYVVTATGYGTDLILQTLHSLFDKLSTDYSNDAELKDWIANVNNWIYTTI